MTLATEHPAPLLAAFGRFNLETDAAHAWLAPLREEAIAAFDHLGFPTLEDEEWRYTNVAPIAGGNFELPKPHESRVDPAQLEPFAHTGLDAHRLVFVDGFFAPELSTQDSFPTGVVVTNLSRTIARQRALLEPHLSGYADFRNDAFTALNTAFIQDGLFVYVPRGVVLERPIHTLFVSSAGDQSRLINVRNLIVAEPAAQATVIEDYVSLDERTAHFVNSVTEISAGDDCVLHHYALGRENRAGYRVSTQRLQQRRGSNVSLHAAILGGLLVRHNVHPVLAGPGAECLVNGLYVTGGKQMVDNHMLVEHAAEKCNSRQFYKGVLDGQSRGVFSGRIIVKPGAQKTDAKQTNMNLLLSDDAQANAKPQLEIYADDVKCTHGATVGQIDEQALFYLRSRGLSLDAARSLLIFAFASDSLGRMGLPALKTSLQRMLLERLPHGEMLSAMV